MAVVVLQSSDATIGVTEKCIQKLRKLALMLTERLNLKRTSALARLAKKDDNLTGPDALEPVTYFSVNI